RLRGLRSRHRGGANQIKSHSVPLGRGLLGLWRVGQGSNAVPGCGPRGRDLVPQPSARPRPRRAGGGGEGVAAAQGARVSATAGEGGPSPRVTGRRPNRRQNTGPAFLQLLPLAGCGAWDGCGGSGKSSKMIKKFDKKDEESGSGSNPFRHLEKSAVLQEARIFNETPINPRRCLHILTKILYLLNQYHALGVLYHLKKNDRLAVSKMLNKFTKSGLKSQFAYCMLIRIASRLLKENDE
ncbi:hypothetical protein MC885_014924, partial [Smutsia gigantea]